MADTILGSTGIDQYVPARVIDSATSRTTTLTETRGRVVSTQQTHGQLRIRFVPREKPAGGSTALDE